MPTALSRCAELQARPLFSAFGSHCSSLCTVHPTSGHRAEAAGLVVFGFERGSHGPAPGPAFLCPPTPDFAVWPLPSGPSPQHNFFFLAVLELTVDTPGWPRIQRSTCLCLWSEGSKVPPHLAIAFKNRVRARGCVSTWCHSAYVCGRQRKCTEFGFFSFYCLSPGDRPPARQ